MGAFQAILMFLFLRPSEETRFKRYSDSRDTGKTESTVITLKVYLSWPPNDQVKSNVGFDIDNASYVCRYFNTVQSRINLLGLGISLTVTEVVMLSKEEYNSVNEMSVTDILNLFATLRNKHASSSREHVELLLHVSKLRPSSQAMKALRSYVLPGKMCDRGQNDMIIMDFGFFSSVNEITKSLVRSIGVETHGFGVSRHCNGSRFSLMSRHPPSPPYKFEECTIKLVKKALQRKLSGHCHNISTHLTDVCRKDKHYPGELTKFTWKRPDVCKHIHAHLTPCKGQRECDLYCCQAHDKLYFNLPAPERGVCNIFQPPPGRINGKCMNGLCVEDDLINS